MPHGLRFVFFTHTLISDWNHGGPGRTRIKPR